ncbi:hypothetical protein M0654_03540 [Rhizobium sp. NTR19]|uniref:Uncharacterized protein n=1 Tax=Neorhizobium turbinariae TaxID=2937795 RepID=A0ABT0IMF1_9HYPH|nr:hypothetical protein [Neorhizobium turbinariae]MCK8779052.1 hypothetical protein [Neorhizobium turbinariae]
MAKSETDRINRWEHELMALTVNSTSMIKEAITLHRLMVEDENKLYHADGKPKARKATRDDAAVREIKAFRILLRLPCLTAEEAQMKLAYFHEAADPNGWSNLDKLWWPAHLDEDEKGGGTMEPLLLRSLYVNGGLPHAK